MKNLKYGLLLILSMVLFSVPVLAAKTYYLPSKIEGESFYEKYTYNKYGHLIKYIDDNEENNEEYTYKYDKNGKRVRGSIETEGACFDLTFDKNQYLKTIKDDQDWREEPGHVTWNKKGYLVEYDNGYYKSRHTYYFSSDGKLKKSALYSDGKKLSLSHYNNDGLLSKTVLYSDNTTITYKYKFNKNGLVNTITKTTTNNDTGKKTVEKIKVSYSKTKTDKKTYTLFINGYRSCEDNALL